ncbi:MAG: hypothetical protein DME04_09765 [Candidatus Rokuibacteriota bacterium]|nr:MAG: hypothetical protein DME04_09765 [Candidatus Rokubacteria bacterium]
MAIVRFTALVGLIVLTSAACATTGDEPPLSSSTTTTLVYGWERHFRLEWAAEPERGGARQLSGYLYNTNGETATTVRVLAQALDPAGAVVGQRIQAIPGGVGGFGRVYFTVPSLPEANSYRVSVWDYTWFQAPRDRM